MLVASSLELERPYSTAASISSFLLRIDLLTFTISGIFDLHALLSQILSRSSVMPSAGPSEKTSRKPSLRL